MEYIMTPWGLGVIGTMCITVLIIVFRVGNIQLSKQGLVVGSSKVKKISPHATCPHNKDIMELVHRTLEYSEKRQELKSFLIEDQMRYYEEVEEEFNGFAKRLFLKLLSKKLPTVETYAQHPEYMAYLVTIRAVSADIKGYIRSCFKTNHYAQKDPEEQRLYIEKKKTVILQKITEFLNLYWRGTVITRSELYEYHQEYMDEFGRYLEDAFNRAFLLAREIHDKLCKEEEEYTKYINDVIFIPEENKSD